MEKRKSKAPTFEEAAALILMEVSADLKNEHNKIVWFLPWSLTHFCCCTKGTLIEALEYE
jgi:hypothetical protein